MFNVHGVNFLTVSYVFRIQEEEEDEENEENGKDAEESEQEEVK